MKKLFLFGLSLTIISSASTQPGFLDSSFGNDGKVIAQDPGLNTATENIFDVLTQPDNKILTVYSSYNFGFNLVRHLPNGSIDSSFGINGKCGFLANRW